METKTEIVGTEFGFTWGTDGTHYYLRNPNGDYRIVPEEIIEGLKTYAKDSTIAEVQTQINKADSKKGEIFSELIDEEYIRPATPVRRLNPPEDVALWPRLLAMGTTFSVATVIVYQIYTTLTEAVIDSYFTPEFLIVFSIIIPGLIIHESGHYLVAQKHLSPEFDFKMKNAVFPAIVMRRNDIYVYPPNRSRWVSLAGPFAGFLYVICMGILYLSFGLNSLIGTGVLLAYYLQILPLLPIVHGDGYEIIVETFNVPNLRTNGIRDLRRAKLTIPSLYALVSFAFPILGFAGFAFISYIQGKFTEFMIPWLIFVALYAWLNRDVVRSIISKKVTFQFNGSLR